VDTPDIHIRIPRKLYESINDLVVKEWYYRSAPEFILECARIKLEEIKRYRMDQRKLKMFWRQQETTKEVREIPRIDGDTRIKSTSVRPNTTYKYQE
jgi:Arc/MetJ-type ribon-helix-helix transcriptional regulator